MAYQKTGTYKKREVTKPLHLIVRLSVDEKARLLAAAESMNITMSDLIQNFCNSLPKV